MKICLENCVRNSRNPIKKFEEIMEDVDLDEVRRLVRDDMSGENRDKAMRVLEAAEKIGQNYISPVYAIEIQNDILRTIFAAPADKQASVIEEARDFCCVAENPLENFGTIVEGKTEAEQ